MTSGNNSKKLHESGENIKKCLLSKEKHDFENVTENVHGNSATRVHHRAFLYSNSMSKLPRGDGVHTTNYRKSRKERGLQSYKSNDENDHPSDNSPSFKTQECVCSAIADVSQKRRISSLSSNVSQRPLVSAASADVSQKPLVSAASADVSQKPPVSTASADVSQKPPVSTASTDISQKPPVSTASTDVSQKPPVSTASGDVSQKPPVSTASADVSQKPPVSTASTDVSQKPPVSTASSDVSQKLPVSTASADVSQKLPVSAAIADVSQKPTVSCDVDTSSDCQMDNVCNRDFSTRQEKSVFGNARERYLSVLEIENSSPSSKVVTAKSNPRRLEPSRKNSFTKDSIAKSNFSHDQVSKVVNTTDGSNVSLLSVNTRSNFKANYPVPKQLSKTAEAQPLNAALNVRDSVLSEQVSLQKCRSSVAVNPSSLGARHCPSPDLYTSKLDTTLSSEISNNPTVKSLQSKFGVTDQRQACKGTIGSASSCVCSKTANLSGARVKIKPSSTIQRIQEQLFHKMESDDIKGSNSKTMQKMVHKTISEQHQVTESNFNELSGKNSIAYTDKLHKEEKPYRQWHRMSRVLTADSKFIISPMLPCHAVSQTKQNNPAPEKSAISVKREASIVEEQMKDRSVVCEPEEVPPVVDIPPGEKETGTCENTELSGTVVKAECAATEVSLTDVAVKSTDGETSHTENGSETLATTLHVVMDDGAQNKSDITANSMNNTENIIIKCQSEQVTTSVNEPELSARRFPKSGASLSMPRHKSLNLKTFYMMKYQSFNELNEVCSSNTRDRHNCSLSTDVVDRMQPLNSVSGASQVTGPSFSEFKNDLFKLPSKKVVSGGPKLRTATRSRNRCNSPGITHGSTNLFRASDSHKAASNLTRHDSRQSREGSGSFNSDRRSDSVRHREQRTCTQPRYARSARTQGTDHDNPECINRNWSSGCAAVGEVQKESVVNLKKPRKVSLADVASKLIQKVNRANIRVPWNDATKKYTEVKAAQDYNGSLPGQLSFRKGQIIKQRSFIAGPSDGMCYGYYRVGRLRKKKKGLFPLNCVATDEPDALDGVSLTSSAKSAI